MKILADQNLPNLEVAFPKPFTIKKFKSEKELVTNLAWANCLICRSNLTIDASIIANFNGEIIASATSGIDHVKLDLLDNIKFYAAQGSNARSVSNYVLATLELLKHEKIVLGQKVGIIGYGYVGRQSAKFLKRLGFEVIIYDPPLGYHCQKKLYSCSILLVHCSYNSSLKYPSENLINKNFLKNLAAGTIIINTARGKIVNEQALLEFSKEIIYCTDVFANEPDINHNIVELAYLATPHIAGHSVAAKVCAIEQLSRKIHEFYNFKKPFFINLEPEVSNDFLKFYNPRPESDLLKKNPGDFLKIRKNHPKRFEFEPL